MTTFEKKNMKKLSCFFIPTGSILFVILMAGFGGSDLKNSSGAPAKNTNSPGDGQNCTHCMGGTAVAVTGWITSDIPVTGYLPGGTYTINVTATGTGKKGYEVSPQDLAGNLIGTLTAGTGSKLVGTNKYVTHSSVATTNPKTWSFQWTAPSGGAGDVTFYGAIIVGSLNTKTTTLTVSQSTVGIEEHRQPVLSVYPNPANDWVTVSFSTETAGMVNIDLLNMHGEQTLSLMQESCPAGSYKKSFTIPRQPGAYLLHLNHRGKNYFSKLIIAD
jgi:hypothetical protein